MVPLGGGVGGSSSSDRGGVPGALAGEGMAVGVADEGTGDSRPPLATERKQATGVPPSWEGEEAWEAWEA